MEDDLDQLAEYVTKLEGLGFSVHCAASAEDGINWVREHAVEVILTDNVLPGMTGLRSIAEFARWSRAPVIVMTSDLTPDVEVDALLLGARRCLKKPLDLVVLSQELQSVCTLAARR